MARGPGRPHRRALRGRRRDGLPGAGAGVRAGQAPEAERDRREPCRRGRQRGRAGGGPVARRRLYPAAGIGQHVHRQPVHLRQAAVLAGQLQPGRQGGQRAHGRDGERRPAGEEHPGADRLCPGAAGQAQLLVRRRRQPDAHGGRGLQRRGGRQAGARALQGRRAGLFGPDGGRGGSGRRQHQCHHSLAQGRPPARAGRHGQGAVGAVAGRAHRGRGGRARFRIHRLVRADGAGGNAAAHRGPAAGRSQDGRGAARHEALLRGAGHVRRGEAARPAQGGDRAGVGPLASLVQKKQITAN